MKSQNRKNELEERARQLGSRLMRFDIKNDVCPGCLDEAIRRLNAVLDGTAMCPR